LGTKKARKISAETPEGLLHPEEGPCSMEIVLQPSDISLSMSLSLKVKVKVTLVQALRLCTGRTAHSGSRGIALPFLDHGH